MFEIRVINKERTRSTKLTSQAQLDIVRDVMNMRVPKTRFNDKVLDLLKAEGISPDFDSIHSAPYPGEPNAKPKSIAETTLDTLKKFEYSSDGFVKRYPTQEEYEAAMVVVTKLLTKKTK